MSAVPHPKGVPSDGTRAPEPRTPYADAAECLHCGLPLSSRNREEFGPFCCAGCKAVHGLIQDAGLGRYYDLKNCVIAPPAQLRRDNFAWLDPVLENATALAGTNVCTLRLDVQGVHCAACVWLLEQLFARYAAGRQLRVNPALGSVEMLWDTERGDLREYLAEVEGFGYRFGPPRKPSQGSSRGLLLRMGVCIAAALNVMMFSISYYFGLAASDGPVYELFGRLNLAIATGAVAYGGWPFYQAAFRGLRRGIVHLDLPIAVGMLLAYAGSTWSYLRSGPESAYFDTITIFVALMLVGRWLQERILERNRNALLASSGVADLYTRRFDHHRPISISVSEVMAADELWIAPGDLVPVQGVLLQRDARVSLDWITGESASVECAPGATIPAGAFNTGETGFRLTATEPFAESRLNDLMGDDGTNDDVRGERWWHRVATIYVVAVLSLATIGFFTWLSHGAQVAVEVAVAILVVTCPCALGLAVPLGRELAHVWLRKRGVLLRSDGFLDRALHVRAIVFDKTGTVTRGQLSLLPASRRALLGLGTTEREILANMTARSTHPVSRCVSAALALEAISAPGLGDPRAFETTEVDALREVVGEGLELEIADHVYRFGRPDFASSGLDHLEGEVRAVFSVDARPLVALDLEEDLRPDAAHEVRALQEEGFDVYLLSGDRPDRVAEVAERLGIDAAHAVGGLDPEAKAARVEAIDVGTMMVGDGLNDSLSFDEALCRATPAVDRAVLPQKSDFYFLGDGIEAVRRALRTARYLRRVQRDNLIFAGVYNLVAVGLALAGHVDPIAAAILMPLSSLTVVGMTSARLSGMDSR